MRISLVIIIYVCLSLHVNAAALAAVSSCPIDSAASQEAFVAIQDQGDIAKARAPLLQQTLDLIKNYPNVGSRSLQEVMSPNDLVKFTEIRSKLNFTSAQDYLISEHARDTTAIVVLWHIALDKANNAFVSAKQYENGPILEEILKALTVSLADYSVTITLPQSLAKCTIELAITTEENTLIKDSRLQAENVNSALDWINGLPDRHPEMNGKMEFNFLNFNEKVRYQKLVKEIIQPEVDRETAIKQAEFFKAMLSLSEERKSDGLSDLARSGGDIDAVGRTFKDRTRDVISKTLVSALYFIGDKIPSEASILAQGIGVGPSATK